MAALGGLAGTAHAVAPGAVTASVEAARGTGDVAQEVARRPHHRRHPPRRHHHHRR